MLKSMSKRKQAEHQGAAAAAIAESQDKQQSSGEAAVLAVSKFKPRVPLFEPQFSPLYEHAFSSRFSSLPSSLPFLTFAGPGACSSNLDHSPFFHSRFRLSHSCTSCHKHTRERMHGCICTRCPPMNAACMIHLLPGAQITLSLVLISLNFCQQIQGAFGDHEDH